MARAVAPARATPAAVRTRRRLPGYATGYLFVGPVILYLIVTAIYPIITVIGMGLQDVDRGVWHFVGLAHYWKILTDPIWWNAVRNTSLFTIASVALQLAVGLAFALLLNEAWFNHALRDTMRGALILPWVFSTAAAALMWSLMYDPYGLVNYITTGLLGWNRPIDFLGNPNLALFSVILVNNWKSYPFYMIALLGGLQSIPPELYDAAKVDGANGWQKFRSVTLPHLRGVLVALSTLDIITTFGHVDLINMLTQGGPGRATETVAFYIYRTGLTDGNLTEAAAASTIMLLLLTVITQTYLRIIQRRQQESW